MKNLFSTFILILLSTFSFSQSNGDIPNIKLKDLDGNTIDTGTINNDGNPVVFCFWATWCSPCKRELNNYSEFYEDWQDETGVKIFAVSIDDQRSINRVGPYINSVEWDYEILLDPNKQFSRAMGVNNVPHTFIVDGNGKIVWQHNNYADGDEEELYHELLKLKK